MYFNIRQLDKTSTLIELDDGFFFKIKNRDWDKLDIKQDISDEQYEFFYQEYGVKKCRFKAIDILSRSDKCEQELRRKLVESYFHPDVIDEVIKFLKEKKYIDDANYVSNYIFYKSEKKTKAQIVTDLRRKGVASDVIEKVIYEEYCEDKEKDIVRKYLNKLVSKDDLSKEAIDKFKISLIRKGIEMRTINEVLDELKMI